MTAPKSVVDEARLRPLFAKGLSFTQIARELGPPVTPGAVAGMCRRLKLVRPAVVQPNKSRESRELGYAFRSKSHREMTKPELNEMLRQAVENTPKAPDEPEQPE